MGAARAALRVLCLAFDRHVGELDAALKQSFVDLCEGGESVLLALELFSPLLDQESDPVLNLRNAVDT